jgi:hypothetical protein
MVGGVPALIDYSGSAPGQIIGQLNFHYPPAPHPKRNRTGNPQDRQRPGRRVPAPGSRNLAVAHVARRAEAALCRL